jgi:magnesium-transporting ATPase (P-type)
MSIVRATDAPNPIHSPRVWHAQTPDQVLAAIESGPTGLTASEAARRLAQHGPNSVGRQSGESALAVLWRQTNNPLIYVLLGSAALAVALGKVVDGLVVLAVVVINSLIGFVQEYRAGKAIQALSAMVPEYATVVRDGTATTIPSEGLVPGDIVTIQSGDRVPADGRLLNARGLRIEEAALTGESVPVDKVPAVVEADVGIGDRRCMLYGGTLVAAGTGTAVIVETGARTELGRISAMLRETTELMTPLTRSMAKVSLWLSGVIAAVALAIMAIGLARGYPLVDAVLAAITLAVAAIPEGLPAIITIALAIGVQRMAARRAIVRKLPSVETLGSTTVICSDKTGTLTRNEMTVRELWTPMHRFQLSGTGYQPTGELLSSGERVEEIPEDVTRLLWAGVLCNDATLSLADGRWKVTGDPTEAALVAAGAKAGHDAARVRAEWPRLDAIPFEAERQYMATLHAARSGERVIVVKGAPEVILARCSSSSAAARALPAVQAFAADGMRVLALAQRIVDPEVETIEEADVAGNLTFLGLQAMIDSPREEAVRAIGDCLAAGIAVKMITGDHVGTATAIGRQIGIVDGAGAGITGAELQRLGDDELRMATRTTSVFARVAPEHKLRLVRALQADGQVVAMTGDGVNDAPALKQSNIGVAMGIAGTAVSKESADIVLADDNFATIAAAVEEGRRVYDNLVKALAFVLPTNLGEALIILIAVLFFPIVDGHPLMPILPIQILWINLVATVALALPLAFEAKEPDLMRRPPRPPAQPILGRFVIVRTALAASIMTAGAIGLFLYEYWTELALGVDPELAVREAQTMAVTSVILFQIFYLLNCRSLRDSLWAIGLWSNPLVYMGIGGLLALQLAFVYLPFMNVVFGSAPLNLDAWTKAMLVALGVLPVVSLEKMLWKRLAPAANR